MNNKNLMFVIAVILIGIIAVAVIDTNGNARVRDNVVETDYSDTSKEGKLPERNS